MPFNGWINFFHIVGSIKSLVIGIIAFSPGFIPPAPGIGQPRIFVSQGENDSVLPVDHTSRRWVPPLKREGHDVTYREFPGQHTVPASVAVEALTWLRWQR
ncbi:hypothetical protein AB0284_17795 [Pseudarthrobacter phenanthrenivorans]|uniref:alpha/beta hydrolase n=1 Tax=Pseudarthrobacter phenanthrenivorans TaxID=361575 RepID=UPI00344E6D02